MVDRRLPPARGMPLPAGIALAALVFAAVLAAVPARAALRWGADAEGGAPYVYRDPANPAAVKGFEVDLAAALEAPLGERIQLVQYEYSSLLVGLDRGDLDVAMNGLEVTADRAAKVLFTEPYFRYRLALTVRRDEARFADLAGAQARGAVVGTLGDTAAERLLATRGVAHRIYDGQLEPYRDLTLGRLDAVLLDDPIARFYAAPDPALRGLTDDPALPGGVYAIAVRRDRPALKARLDAALRALCGSGELPRLLAAWNLGEGNPCGAEVAAGQGRYGAAGAATSAATGPASGAAASGAAASGAAASGAAASGAAASGAGASGAPGAASGDASGGGPGDLAAASRVGWTPRRYLPLLFAGAWVTVQVSVASMVLAVVIGLLLALARLWGPAPVRWAAVVYIEAFRGVPVLLVLFFLYYGLPSLGVELSAMTAAIVGFGLHYAAYEAEIYRAALQSVPPGQWEAALALGMAPLLALRRVVLPQALRVALPPMTNDFVALFKDTSLVSVIAVVELTKQYQILAKSSLKYLELGLATAALYLAISVPLGALSRRLEGSRGAP